MTPFLSDPDVTLYHGDALEALRVLPDGIADACVTSPPYLDARPEYPSPTPGDCTTASCPNEADRPDGLCSYCRHSRREAPPMRCQNHPERHSVDRRGMYARLCAECKEEKKLARAVEKAPPVPDEPEVAALKAAPPPIVEAARGRVYLAGPMRGIPLYNFPAFEAAAADLRARGYDVWSPAEADQDVDGFDPATDVALPMRHYMRRDLPAVLDADLVVVLPGWQTSAGARLEVHVADACDVPVMRYPDLVPARHPSSRAFHRKLAALGETHDRKNADYGNDRDSLANIRASETLGIEPWVAAEVRIGDKTARIASFVQKGELANESVQDSILDRAVYSVIQLVLLDEAAHVALLEAEDAELRAEAAA